MTVKRLDTEQGKIKRAMRERPNNIGTLWCAESDTVERLTYLPSHAYSGIQRTGWKWSNCVAYGYGIGPARYPVPAIPIKTVIADTYVAQQWQYGKTDDNRPLHMAQCYAGDYYAMTIDYDWRTEFTPTCAAYYG